MRLIPLLMKASILSRTCHCRGQKVYNRRVVCGLPAWGPTRLLAPGRRVLGSNNGHELFLGVSPADKQLKAPSPRSFQKQSVAADHSCLTLLPPTDTRHVSLHHLPVQTAADDIAQLLTCTQFLVEPRIVTTRVAPAAIPSELHGKP